MSDWAVCVFLLAMGAIGGVFGTLSVRLLLSHPDRVGGER